MNLTTDDPFGLPLPIPLSRRLERPLSGCKFAFTRSDLVGALPSKPDTSGENYEAIKCDASE